MNNNRIKYFDISRALCMIWIISFWHMQRYSSLNLNSLFGKMFTEGVLACFVFISAIFIGKKKISNKQDIVCFYKQRLKRVYPLFFISATSMLMIHYIFGYNYIGGVKQYILTLIGIVCIWKPVPSTIWYISLLILFYFLSPFFLYERKRIFKNFMFSIIFLLIIGLNILFKSVDDRIFWLYPLYFITIIYNNKIQLTDNFFIKRFIESGITILAVFLIRKYIIVGENLVTDCVLKFLSGAAITIFILEGSKILQSINIIWKIFNIISYLSMAAYLFHRQIIGIMYMLIGEFSIVWVIIASVICFAISFAIQYIYDKFLFFFSLKKENNRKDKLIINNN